MLVGSGIRASCSGFSSMSPEGAVVLGKTLGQLLLLLLYHYYYDLHYYHYHHYYYCYCYSYSHSYCHYWLLLLLLLLNRVASVGFGLERIAYLITRTLVVMIGTSRRVHAMGNPLGNHAPESCPQFPDWTRGKLSLPLYIYIYIYIHTHTCIHKSQHKHVYTYIYIYIYRIYIYIYIYTHMYIH